MNILIEFPDTHLEALKSGISYSGEETLEDTLHDYFLHQLNDFCRRNGAVVPHVHTKAQLKSLPKEDIVKKEVKIGFFRYVLNYFKK